MLKIRLQRIGKKKSPSYRLIIAEQAKDTQGRSLEILGHYNPVAQPKVMEFKKDRILHWIGQGAQPSESVHNLLVGAGILEGKKQKSVSISNKRQAKIGEKKQAEEDKKKEAEEKAVAEAEAAKAAAAEEKAAAEAAETAEAEKPAAEDAPAEEADAPAEEKKEDVPAESAPDAAESAEVEKEEKTEA